MESIGLFRQIVDASSFTAVIEPAKNGTALILERIGADRRIPLM